MIVTSHEHPPSASVKDLTDAYITEDWLDLKSDITKRGFIDASVIEEVYAEIGSGKISRGILGSTEKNVSSSRNVKIRNAVIRGQIDLTGCEGLNGGGIASLIIHNCIFERAKDSKYGPDLDFSDSIIRSVQITNSRLSHIRAIGASVIRSINLSGSAPLNKTLANSWSFQVEQKADAQFDNYFENIIAQPKTALPDFLIENRTLSDKSSNANGTESEFWVDMRDIKISGDLIARRTIFRTPSLRSPSFYKPWQTRYAMKLGGSRISGSIKVNDQSVFDGGINLHLARIDGEVWLGGAHIRAGEGGAIDGMASEIGGLYAQWPRLLVKGEINLDRANIRGDLLLPNAIIECDPSQPRSNNSLPKAISATTCKIGNDCFLQGKFLANGGIYIRGIEIGGDLSVAQARVVSHHHISVDCDFAVISGRADFKSGSFFGTISLRAANIKTSLDFNGATIFGRVASDEKTVYAIAAMDIVVGHNCLFGESGVAYGSINLVRANIHSDLGIYRLSIRLKNVGAQPLTKSDYSLDLGWANIGGNLILNKNEIDGSVRLSHARARVLCDTTTGYPDNVATLHLNGFKYEDLLHHSMDIERSDASTCVSSRLEWLKKMRSYDPQPYIWLSQILSRNGRKEEAREIFIEKQNQDRKQKRDEIKNGSLLMWLPRMIILLSSKLFHLMFGDGLKPVNALVTLFVATLIGASVFWYANNQRLLIVDQQAVATGVSQSRIGAVVSDNIDDSIWCSDNISPTIYALDVFIPLIDLRHESACKVGESSTAMKHARFSEAFDFVDVEIQVDMLSYFKAIYSILGWLLISLAIITFSGAVRRRLEL